MPKGLALMVGSEDGQPILARLQGKCTPLEEGDLAAGVITGSDSNGIPIIGWADQKCKPETSIFEEGKRYIGLITGETEDGIPIISSWCEECEEDPDTPVTGCDCEICTTLESTVQFPTGTGLPTVFGTAVDATLEAGGSFDITNIQVCQDESFENICYKHEVTWAGGSGSYVSLGKTYNWTTTVWVSDEKTGGPAGLTGIHSVAGEVTFTGDFKVYFALTEYIIQEEGEEDVKCCALQWGVLVKYDITDESSCSSGSGWGFWVSRSFSFGAESPCALRWVLSECEYPETDCCPPGYIDITPEGAYIASVCYPGTFPPYLSGGIAVDEGCLFSGEGAMSTYSELWIRIFTDPDDDDHRYKCIKMTIADLC